MPTLAPFHASSAAVTTHSSDAGGEGEEPDADVVEEHLRREVLRRLVGVVVLEVLVDVLLRGGVGRGHVERGGRDGQPDLEHGPRHAREQRGHDDVAAQRVDGGREGDGGELQRGRGDTSVSRWP